MSGKNKDPKIINSEEVKRSLQSIGDFFYSQFNGGFSDFVGSVEFDKFFEPIGL